MLTATLTRETVIEELKMLKQELVLRFGVTRLGLFGSCARGESRRDSDIDVVVELTDPDLFALVHIKEILEEKLNHPVDVILNNNYTNPFLKKRIQNEAIDV